MKNIFNNSKNKTELDTIKDHMVDVDTILTKEEHVILDESIKNEKEGKLVPLDG